MTLVQPKRYIAVTNELIFHSIFNTKFVSGYEEASFVFPHFQMIKVDCAKINNRNIEQFNKIINVVKAHYILYI